MSNNQDNNQKNLSNPVLTGLLKFSGVIFLLIVGFSIIKEIQTSGSDEISQMARETERVLEEIERKEQESAVTQYINKKLISQFSVGDAVAKREDLSDTGIIARIENNQIYVNWDLFDSSLELSENVEDLIIIDRDTKDIIYKPDIQDLQKEALNKYAEKKQREKQIEKGYELVKEEMLENFSYNDRIAIKDDLSKKGRVLEVIENGTLDRGEIKVEWENEEIGDLNTVEVEDIVKLDSENNVIWQPPSPSELPKNNFEKWIQDVF